MNASFALSEKIILGSLIALLFIIGLWNIAFPKNSTAPELFRQDNNFFKLEVNTASYEEFCLCMSPYVAGKIIEYRNAKGHIEDINELSGIKGIGLSRFKRIKDYLKVVK